MKHICCLYAAHAYGLVGECCNGPVPEFGANLAPEDILYVQELFLTNGFHCIRVPTIGDGRSLVHKLVSSMYIFDNVACLTRNDGPAINFGVCNLAHELRIYCHGDESEDSIEEYFLERFFSDLMWVELDDFLLEDQLVKRAIYVMHDMDIAHRMPVIAISYGNPL